ncbi:hypothetical protein GUJ93_ZPchr0005g14508 [Zizania palustris]|uniref:Uncharacterized protein n=1 Tax=Zizania palustris TaxID=103762 RepID=A0A8J5S410_ZIZPA|nr:hypothetical protein GUJ93_ZPchr0005g14508 [Zizania palustris]
MLRAANLLELEGRFARLGLLMLVKSTLNLDDLQSQRTQAWPIEDHRLDGGHCLEVLALYLMEHLKYSLACYPSSNVRKVHQSPQTLQNSNENGGGFINPLDKFDLSAFKVLLWVQSSSASDLDFKASALNHATSSFEA